MKSASPGLEPVAAEQPMPAPEQLSFHLGEQALIEGVMMRSPHFVAASVRRADGSIETRVEPFHSVLEGRLWLRLPLLRATIESE